jgi:hypothetical protein
MPDIHLGTMQRLTACHVNDLHGEAEVDASLAGADVSTLGLAFVPERAVGGETGECAAGVVVELWIVVPAKIEKVLRFSRMVVGVLVI